MQSLHHPSGGGVLAQNAATAPGATFEGLSHGVFGRRALPTWHGSRLQKLGQRSSPLFCGQQSLHVALPVERTRRRAGRVYVAAEATEGGTTESIIPGGVTAKNGARLDSMPDSVEALRGALVAAEMRAAAAERERRAAEEALAEAKAAAEALSQTMVATTEEAMAEVETAKRAFQAELEKVAAEKKELAEQLVDAREGSIDLALKVEKMASLAMKEATSHITEEAQLRIAEARTEAVDASAQVEERIRRAADEAAASVIEEAKATIEDALQAAEMAKEQAQIAENALKARMGALDELAAAETLAAKAQEQATQLEVRLKLAENAAQQLRAEVSAAQARAEAAESRIAGMQESLHNIQRQAEEASRAREESTKRALEAMKAAAAGREEATLIAYRAETNTLRAAALAAQKAQETKEAALARRFQALERSLQAAQKSAVAWQQRASALEDLLQEVKEKGFDLLREAGEADILLNGGRMDVMLGNQSEKWKLLADGPRRERPDWLKRKSTAGLLLPPLKVEPPEEDVEAAMPLQLPSPDEVWSISDHKVLEDEYTKQAAQREHEARELEEQRQQLEKALQRKTLKRRQIPEDLEDKLESGTGTGREIVLQGFNWESHRRNWYLELAPRAADLAACGITTVWLPPPTASVSPQGYMPTDLYNLNSGYGTQEELKICIDEMHKHDILVLGDVVLNHRCAAKQGKDGIWNIFGGKMAWGPEAIVRDDPNFHGKGNPSSGDIFHAAPNIDHSQEFVRKDIREWLQWLRTEIGYDGWRLDFARGFWGGYVKEYIEASTPAFAIGEYWDSLAYEGGTVCYNQDAHRQRIINWINATGGTSSAFDVTTKGILHAALHHEYWRLIDPQGKPPGVMGWWPSRAVTFLENHDTGSTQGHWPFPRDKLQQGYAYILTHPGTPVIFYDHLYDFGMKERLSELVAARMRCGVHCRSPVKIFQATAEGYVAQIGDSLVMKIGESDWNPSKQDNLVGNWQRFLDCGADYQLWEKK